MTNPYQAPGGFPPEHGPNVTGGSMDAALNGEYEFSISEVLREAWEKSDGAKGAFWGAFAILFVVAGVTNYAQKHLLGDTQAAQILGGVLFLPITGPLYTGVFMMGVRRAADMPITAGDVFRYLNPYNINLVIVQILLYLMVIAGFALLILPGIYLAISYYFASGLVADKGLQPWEAMEVSRKSVGHKWWQFFGFGFAITCLGMISIIPLGIGLIWALPTMLIATGVLYRKLFGVNPDPGF